MKRFFLLITIAVTLAAGNADAKEWQLISSFSGRPAMSVLFDNNPADGTDRLRLDFDGDGVQDIAFFDGKGNDVATELTIVSGADPQQRWQIPLPNGIIGILIAFLDLDGNTGGNGAVKEIVLAQKAGLRFINPVVLYNVDATAGTYEVRIWDSGTILIGGWDTDGDGVFELVIGDQNKNEVQVWGLR